MSEFNDDFMALMITRANRANVIAENVGKWLADVVPQLAASKMYYEDRNMTKEAEWFAQRVKEGQYILEDLREVFTNHAQDVQMLFEEHVRVIEELEKDIDDFKKMI